MRLGLPSVDLGNRQEVFTEPNTSTAYAEIGFESRTWLVKIKSTFGEEAWRDLSDIYKRGGTFSRTKTSTRHSTDTTAPQTNARWRFEVPSRN